MRQAKLFISKTTKTSQLAVRRVLVLIQVGSLRSPKTSTRLFHLTHSFDLPKNSSPETNHFIPRKTAQNTPLSVRHALVLIQVAALRAATTSTRLLTDRTD